MGIKVMSDSKRKSCVSVAAMSAIILAASMSLVSCERTSKKSVYPSRPTEEALVWKTDQYLPIATYKNFCQFPRSGVDPLKRKPYPDQNASMLDELFYLRSLTRETYLFRQDLTDMDPAKYNVVQNNFADHVVKMNEYFNELKSKETTASGNPKDKYHYTELTSDYNARILNTAEPSFGISWVILSEYELRDNRRYMQIPRDLRVRYVEPNSPAAEIMAGSPKVKRGDKVLKVNGADFIRGNDTAKLNAIFVPDSSKNTTIVFQDVDTKQEKTVVLKAKNLSRQPVNLSKVIEVDGAKVGYIHYTTFATQNSDSSFNDAVKSLKTAGINDLVLDIRYNGGGYLIVSSMVGYMIAGDTNTRNKTFEKLVFHEGTNGINPVTGQRERPTLFYNAGFGPPHFTIPDREKLASLNLNKVYILTTDRTCSASESLINALIGIDVEVIQIGGTTCGKPYGFIPDDNCGITYYTIQFAGVNHKNFGAYADGFVPSTTASNQEAKVKGCVVADDYNHQLGTETEPLLAAALKFRKDGKCPVPPSPPSPPGTIDAVASSRGRVSELIVQSNLEVPDDPYYEDDRLLIREN